MSDYSPEFLILFFSRVQKGDDLNACWLWTAGVDRGGYGQIWNNRNCKAHRVSYEIAFGPIPAGLHVLHTCDTPGCVNPLHLWLGTNLDNVRDCQRKNRNSHPAGEKNGQCKLSDAQVAEVRLRYAKGDVSMNRLAKEFSVSHTLIGYIVNRQQRK